MRFVDLCGRINISPQLNMRSTGALVAGTASASRATSCSLGRATECSARTVNTAGVQQYHCRNYPK